MIIGFIIRMLTDERIKNVSLAREFRDFFYHLNTQALSRIPGLSALAALLVGSWVASTFTTSHVKGFLASHGFMKGGTCVVSDRTYVLLSISVPILAAALAAYAIQKVMKTHREKQLGRNMARVAQMGKEVQTELQEKLDILEKAREAGLISAREHSTKTFNLYQSYSRNCQLKFQESLIKKITS